MLEITLNGENYLNTWGPRQGEVSDDALCYATYEGTADQIRQTREKAFNGALRAVCDDCAQESDACMTLGTVRGMNGYWLCAWCKLDQMGPGVLTFE